MTKSKNIPALQPSEKSNIISYEPLFPFSEEFSKNAIAKYCLKNISASELTHRLNEYAFDGAMRHKLFIVQTPHKQEEKKLLENISEQCEWLKESLEILRHQYIELPNLCTTFAAFEDYQQESIETRGFFEQADTLMRCLDPLSAFRIGIMRGLNHFKPQEKLMEEIKVQKSDMEYCKKKLISAKRELRHLENNQNLCAIVNVKKEIFPSKEQKKNITKGPDKARHFKFDIRFLPKCYLPPKIKKQLKIFCLQYACEYFQAAGDDMVERNQQKRSQGDCLPEVGQSVTIPTEQLKRCFPSEKDISELSQQITNAKKTINGIKKYLAKQEPVKKGPKLAEPLHCFIGELISIFNDAGKKASIPYVNYVSSANNSDPDICGAFFNFVNDCLGEIRRKLLPEELPFFLPNSKKSLQKHIEKVITQMRKR